MRKGLLHVRGNGIAHRLFLHSVGGECTLAHETPTALFVHTYNTVKRLLSPATRKIPRSPGDGTSRYRYERPSLLLRRLHVKGAATVGFGIRAGWRRNANVGGHVFNRNTGTGGFKHPSGAYFQCWDVWALLRVPAAVIKTLGITSTQYG
jgi:hypothetical protein